MERAMSIKARLFLWLMPALILFIGLISYTAYNGVNQVIGTPTTASSESLLLSILLVSAATLIAFALLILTLAYKISSPVNKLKDAALSIAAGEYGESVHVEGPPEVVELANTLNTMSQCLEEQIQCLRDNSLARERLYGEYECSRLLQQYLLQQEIERSKIPKFKGRTLRSSSAKQFEGIYLQIDQADDKLQFLFSENREPGFEGMIELIKSSQNPKDNYPPRIVLNFHSNKNEMFSESYGMIEPIIWQTKTSTCSLLKGSVRLQKGDFLILFNTSFAKLFSDPKHVQDWFAKVLRHFAEEGLDPVTTMLNNELNFLTNKHHINQDIHILCLHFIDS